MGPALVSFLFTVGASAWLFNKLQRYSGNNTRQTIIATGVSALIMFVVLFFILSLIFNE